MYEPPSKSDCPRRAKLHDPFELTPFREKSNLRVLESSLMRLKGEGK
jgi:hypothetical protein